LVAASAVALIAEPGYGKGMRKTLDEVKAKFLALPEDRRARVVSLLAYNLTLGARAIFAVPVEEGLAVKKLRALNELQHMVSARLMRVVAGQQQDYPDEDFLDALFDQAQVGGCERDLLEAFQWSLAARQ
jgi:hypothetical protein